MSTLFTKIMPLIVGIAIILISRPGMAQEASLDQYIRLGLDNNESLKQREFGLEKAVYALQEAKTLFLPKVSIEGAYTKAGGGRTIDFPIGDMLNPIYATLNELTASNEFSQLDNASILLNPDNFYDVKLRTVLPLINAEIWYNQKVKNEMITQQEAAVNAYKRHLVKEIKTAYFQLFKADNATEIYRAAVELAFENIRVNQSLYKNGVVNATALTRAQTEKQKLTASLNEAINDKKNAEAYFNFLLNRPLDSPIHLSATPIEEPDSNPSLEGGIKEREELVQLKSAFNAQLINKNMQQGHLIPKVSTFLDLGSQGFDWQVDSRTPYYFWGVNLQWDLFGANQYKYQIKQTEADLKQLTSNLKDTENTLALQLEQARNAYHIAYTNYHSAKTHLTLAEQYYKDQLKRYKAGEILFVELLDAQNEITEASLKRSASLAQTQIALAALEHSLATYPL